MLRLDSSGFMDDWFVIDGGDYCDIEGSGAEWREVAKAIRSGENVYFKRVAAKRQGDGSYHLWSPRNSVSSADVKVCLRGDVEAFAAHIDEVLDANRPKPTVVCLCGSTRFMDAFQEANLRLTLEGKIVLSVGCNTKSDASLGLDSEVKKRLDELHLRKIELSDEILVLNVGGYIGESTSREIEHARSRGKIVSFLEPLP